MSRPVPPCGKSCPRRSPVCHNPETCMEWRTYQEQLQTYHAAIKSAKRAQTDYDEVRKHNMPDLVRRKNERKRDG